MVNFRFELIMAMKEMGHEVHTISPDYQDFVEERLCAGGVNYHLIFFERTGSSFFSDYFSFFKLRKKIKEIKPDLVFSFTAKPVIYGSLAAKSAGVKKVFSLISGLGSFGSPDLSKKEKVIRAITFLLYKIAFLVNNKVIFQNNDDRERLIRNHIVPERKTVRVFGSGVNLNRFPYSTPPVEPVKFIYIGRFLKRKGVVDYVVACKKIKAKFPEVECILLGQTDTTPGAIKKSEIKAWEKEGYITYIPKQRDVKDYLSAASVFVLPSYYGEGVPRTALEAMATGRALIVSDSTGCRDTVWENENGFLVPIKDPDAIANAMEKFLFNKSLIIQMGKRSRELAEEYFDVDKVNKETLKILFE